MVLLDAICTMKPKPATTRHGIDSQSTVANENAISPVPNEAQAMMMMRPRPITDCRVASHSAPDERAAAGCAHQKTERVRPAVEHGRGKDRHQHRVRHADQADQRQQQDDRADRPEAERVVPAFDEQLSRPWTGAGRTRRGAIRIASSEAMTPR